MKAELLWGEPDDAYPALTMDAHAFSVNVQPNGLERGNVEAHGRYEDMAYGPIGKEVLGSQPFTEADPIGVHAALLALFSAAINGHVTQPGGRPVVVWTALAGRSSLGCKGTALEAAEWILDPALSAFLNHHRRQGISSGPSLINALHEQYEKSLTTEDGPDGRLVVIEEEWQNQLRRTNRCPTFSGNFRTAWDGKTVVNTTKGKKPGERDEQRVDNPQLGFHSHIQPGAWAKYISDTEALGGSYNRILPVLVHRSKFLPSPEEGEERPIFQYTPTKTLKLAYDWARKEKRVMTLSSAARKRFDELRMTYEEQNAELPEVLASFFERSAEQVWRVAAVLTAANRKTVIPREAIEAARHFVDYSIASVTQLVNLSASNQARTATPLDDLIRRWLNKLGGEATRSVLYRSLGSGRYSAEEIERTAEGMPDVEIIEVRNTGRSGAKPKKFRLVAETASPAEPMAPVVPSARPAEAEALLTLYAEWAGKAENAGKSLTDFLAHGQAQGQAKGQTPARKATAKRPPAPRKAATPPSSTTTRTRGTASKRAAAKTTSATTAPRKSVAKPAAQKAVSQRSVKKAVAASAIAST
ncbi:hypothetical protein ACIBAH_34820 [Streptomyces sp. NPDC051445]|uniref:hypothetical protein n=1 Tax=Streptomyces sp. NPDC051445 TaxID=3365653 RepID=UPI0037991D90